MAKSESTKKLSSNFSMDNILGQSPEKFDVETEQQHTPLRLGSTSPSMYQDRGQLSPSSSSVRSSCESPMGSNSPSPPLGPSPPLAIGQPPFALAHVYAQAWASVNLIQRMALLQGQQQQQNPQNLAGKSNLLRKKI